MKHPVFGSKKSFYLKFSSRRHSLNRIWKNIHQYLLNLLQTGIDMGQIGLEFLFNINPLTLNWI